MCGPPVPGTGRNAELLCRAENKTPKPPPSSCTGWQPHLPQGQRIHPPWVASPAAWSSRLGVAPTPASSAAPERNRGKKHDQNESTVQSCAWRNEFTSLLRLPSRTGRISAVPPAGQHQKGNVPTVMMEMGRSAQPGLYRPQECFHQLPHTPNGRLVQALPGRKQAVKEQGNLWIYILLLPPPGLSWPAAP